MLKIKDNVDLKELEKYGFILEKEIENYELNYSSNPDGFDGLSISERSRIVNIFTSYRGKTYDTLYDLIKADLVEKVGDKE